MAKIFPSIFPYSLDDPEMLKLGIQTEFEVYNKLKKFSNSFEIFCGPTFLKKMHMVICEMENMLIL